jgi:hypothetical protein
MPIDPNIPLQAKSVQLESPMNQLAMAGNVMKIGEMQRSIDTQNKLRDLFSQGIDVSTSEGFNRLASVDPASAIKLRRDALEGVKLQGDIKKNSYELTAKGMDIMRERTKDLLGNTSNENYIAHIQEGLRDGLISPEQAKRSVQTFTAIPSNDRAAYLTQSLAKAEKVYEMNTMSAADKARLGQAERHFQIGQQGAGQTLTDSAGNVTVLDKQGNVMKQLGNIGKPSATFEKTAALQKQMGKDLTLAIGELERVTKDGGLIDQSTGSGAGRLVDVAAGFAGQSTAGSEAIAKLKPIADVALKMVPRFEGPQSDKDTQSYKEAAGQLADPTVPTATRKAAGREVLRLMKARKGQFVNEAMAAEGIGAGTPALPSGFTVDK